MVVERDPHGLGSTDDVCVRHNVTALVVHKATAHAAGDLRRDVKHGSRCEGQLMTAFQLMKGVCVGRGGLIKDVFLCKGESAPLT